MRGAGLPVGETRQFATTLDISATILAAAGAAIPNEYQGFDLLGPISQGLPSPRTVGIACEYRAMSVCCLHSGQCLPFLFPMHDNNVMQLCNIRCDCRW